MRYDGIYRIARAYRKPGAQRQLVCRYLFVRCDNEPAPWSSEGELPLGADSTCALHIAQPVLLWAVHLCREVNVMLLGKACRQHVTSCGQRMPQLDRGRGD